MKTTSKKNLFSIPLKFRPNLSWDWLSSLRLYGLLSYTFIHSFISYTTTTHDLPTAKLVMYINVDLLVVPASKYLHPLLVNCVAPGSCQVEELFQDRITIQLCSPYN